MCTLRKKKKDKLEEYHSGKTADLRNVIAEIQKVDQETADLSSVVEEVQRIDRKSTYERKDTLVTCRVLFYSVLDKIFLLFLVLGFLLVTYLNYKGNIFSASYGFWMRTLYQLLYLILFAVIGAFVNWIYQCIVKTMLCVTKHSIYKECYFPFFRREISIPIEHVTAVSTINFLWIFRCVIVYQYRHFPMVFFTWNNQKFKNKVDELLGNEQSIYNGYNNKNLFQPKYVPIIQWIVIILAMILLVLGIVHFFAFVFSTEKKLSGTYLKGNQKIVLNVNGSCDLRMSRIKNLKSCKWTVDADDNSIAIQYEFSKDNYYGETYNTKENIKVAYKDDTLIYNGIEYSKK